MIDWEGDKLAVWRYVYRITKKKTLTTMKNKIISESQEILESQQVTIVSVRKIGMINVSSWREKAKIIIFIIFTLWEVFIPVLSGVFPLKSE